MQKLPHSYPIGVMQALAEMHLAAPRYSQGVASTVATVKARQTELQRATDELLAITNARVTCGCHDHGQSVTDCCTVNFDD